MLCRLVVGEGVPGQVFCEVQPVLLRDRGTFMLAEPVVVEEPAHGDEVLVGQIAEGLPEAVTFPEEALAQTFAGEVNVFCFGEIRLQEFEGFLHHVAVPGEEEDVRESFFVQTAGKPFRESKQKRSEILKPEVKIFRPFL